jgi:ribonuclease Z
MLRVTFLGTAGALPTTERNPSAILINRKGELILFDCGEGTQQQMMRAKTGMMNLTSIFLTHFHADHVLGIPGLLQTMNFQGRVESLEIFGPKYVKEFVELLSKLGFNNVAFEVKPRELKPRDVLYRNEYCIEAIKTEHSVPSLGYVLREKPRQGRFNRERAIELGIPPGPLFGRLQRGEMINIKGKIIKPEEVIGPPRPGRVVVYSGDTRPCEAILNASQNADLLIHDGTLTSEMQEWAIETKHSTALEAAELARKANVKQLVLTHISSRYSADSTPLLEEARKVFSNTLVAKDLLEIEIPYRD